MPHPLKPTWKERQRWWHQSRRCGRSVADTCRIFDISRKTYYKWRLKDFGPKAPYAPPRGQPNAKLTPDVRIFIEREKRRTNYGPAKMALAVGRRFGLRVSSTVIFRFYRRKGLVRKPQRKLGWYAPLRERLVISRPGEGVQLDVKYVYPHGRRQYQFTLIDPLTEQLHFRIFDSRHSRNAVLAFREAEVAWGFRIRSVQTDNGSEFRGEFHSWCQGQGVPHHFIPKRSPYWNAKVERSHRTIDDEYYQNPLRAWRTPSEWLWFYNNERLHLTLGGLTPREFYLKKCHP
jgi:transposase InsO family protein